MCMYMWVYIWNIDVYTHDCFSVRYRNTAGFIDRRIKMVKDVSICSSFLIQRLGLRLREEATVLCFTEKELNKNDKKMLVFAVAF